MIIAHQIKQDILINEIMTMKQSRHDNLVNFIDSYLVDDCIWVSMEYINGASLTQVIEAHAQLTPNILLEEELISSVLKNVVAGLEYLHQQQIIHRLRNSFFFLIC